MIKQSFLEKSLPEKMSPIILLRYYRFLRFGKCERVRKEAANKICLGHIRLGLLLVSSFRKSYPHKNADMISDMLFGLVKGCELMSKGAIDHHEVPNVTGYLLRTAKGMIQKSLAKDRKIKQLAVDVIIHDHKSDVGEIIERAILSPRDRIIIEFRAQGYKDADIGRMIDPPLSGSMVHNIRSCIRKRAMEYLNEVIN